GISLAGVHRSTGRHGAGVSPVPGTRGNRERSGGHRCESSLEPARDSKRRGRAHRRGSRPEGGDESLPEDRAVPAFLEAEAAFRNLIWSTTQAKLSGMRAE